MIRGRHKTFNESEVLERAMQLFWLRGYNGVALAELAEAMRISRWSLHNTFGNKRSLFMRSIEHYRATQLSEALALLEREDSPLDNVRGVLGFFRDLALDAGSESATPGSGTPIGHFAK